MRVLGLQDDLSQFVIGRDRLHPDDRAAIWARWCNVEDQKKKFGEGRSRVVIMKKNVNRVIDTLDVCSTL